MTVNHPPDELEWLAFRYLHDEMEVGEREAFEQLLLQSQAAREAVASAVELTSLLHCALEPMAQPQESHAHKPATFNTRSMPPDTWSKTQCVVETSSRGRQRGCTSSVEFPRQRRRLRSRCLLAVTSAVVLGALLLLTVALQVPPTASNRSEWDSETSRLAGHWLETREVVAIGLDEAELELELGPWWPVNDTWKSSESWVVDTDRWFDEPEGVEMPSWMVAAVRALHAPPRGSEPESNDSSREET